MDLGSVPGHWDSDNAVRDETSKQPEGKNAQLCIQFSFLQLYIYSFSSLNVQSLLFVCSLVRWSQNIPHPEGKIYNCAACIPNLKRLRYKLIYNILNPNSLLWNIFLYPVYFSTIVHLVFFVEKHNCWTSFSLTDLTRVKTWFVGDRQGRWIVLPIYFRTIAIQRTLNFSLNWGQQVPLFDFLHILAHQLTGWRINREFESQSTVELFSINHKSRPPSLERNEKKLTTS